MSNNYILTPNGELVNEDELKHYGVKGMKWGVRKADEYAAKSKAAKKFGDNSGARKFHNQSEFYKRYSKLNKKQADVKTARSKGAALATNLLGGFFANRTYNSVIAAGGSKWAARGATFAAGILGGPFGLQHIVISEAITAVKAKNE